MMPQPAARSNRKVCDGPAHLHYASYVAVCPIPHGGPITLRLCCKSHRGEAVEKNAQQSNRSDWILESMLSLNQSCALGCAKSFCNRIPPIGALLCNPGIDVTCQFRNPPAPL